MGESARREQARESARSEGRDRPPEDTQRVPRGMPARLLALQRLAGNRAVTELVRVQRQDQSHSSAVPVRFAIENRITRLPDGGFVSYMSWQSSTGDLNDFRTSAVQLREVVRYGDRPNPPFTQPFSADNPVVLELSAEYLRQGRAPDRHIGLKHTLLRTAGSAVAHQVYEFRPNPTAAWQVLASFTITRTVYSRGGRWFYRVAKSGVRGTVFNDTPL